MRDPECRFCQIVSGEVPAHVVLDDESVVAFLDNRPLFPGHCLVVPRHHHETLVDLPETQVPALFRSVRRMASAVQSAMDAEGTFVAMNNRVSQSVPHLHVHVVPRRRKDGLRGFFWPRQPYPGDDDMAAVAERLRVALTAGP